MRHCDGRLFDGGACNNDLFDCPQCGTTGCFGDGCDNQRFTSSVCDGCGAQLLSGTLTSTAA